MLLTPSVPQSRTGRPKAGAGSVGCHRLNLWSAALNLTRLTGNSEDARRVSRSAEAQDGGAFVGIRVRAAV
jgi:hypothetical protein